MIFKLCNNGKSVVGTREDGAMVSYSIEVDEYKQWLSEGNTPEPEFTDAEIAQQIEDAKPKSITMRQARLALLAHNKLSDVQTTIDSLPSPMKEQAQIEWEYASHVEINNPLIVQLMSALGFAETTLSDLFVEASLL